MTTIYTYVFLSGAYRFVTGGAPPPSTYPSVPCTGSKFSECGMCPVVFTGQAVFGDGRALQVIVLMSYGCRLDPLVRDHQKEGVPDRD